MRFVPVLAAGLVLTLTACGAPATPAGQTTETPSAAACDAAFPVTVKHAYGETVIESKPERVATVAWANHDVALALGVVPVGFAAQTYGVTDASGVHEWTAARLAELGAETPTLFDETDGINFEAVNDTNPDVILAGLSGITQEEYDTGKATPIEDTLNVQTPKRGCMSANVAIAGAGYFCDYVTKVIRNDEAFGKTEEERLGRLYRGGLTIWTTLDKQMQADADKEVKAGVPVDDPSGIGTAMIVVEPGTGQIKAMAQNRIYNNTQDHGKRETAVNFNTDNKYGSASGFPPGSTFKPFTLLQWLKEGHALGETINGTKLKYNLSEFNAPCTNLSGTWEFGNAEGKGAVMTVLQATMNSVNSGYVAMASKINLCDIFTGAAEIGVHKAGGLAKDGPVDPLPANVLGSQSVAPLTMANAFATFAANGVYCQPVAILKATDSNGEELKVPSANCSQKIDEGVAKAMNYALSNVWNGTAKGIARPGFAAAGKTGTTTHNEHTWFVGYTPRLAAAVWVGHTDAMKSMHGLTINGRNYSGFGAGPWGSSIAAPTWVRFMNAALGGGDNPGFDTPPNDLVHGKKISVPNVIGMKENEARSALAARGFQVVVSTQRVPSALEAGRVAEQDPQGWAVAGSVITLRLSDGSQQNWDPCKDDPNRPECKKDDEKGPPGRDRDRGRDDSANRP